MITLMKNTTRIFLFSIIAMLLLSACGQDNKDNSRETLSINLSIIDTSGAPVDDVSINVLEPAASKATVSSELSASGNGNYQLNKIPELAELVLQLEKSGYASQIKPVSTLTATQTLRIEPIVMIKQQNPINFSADTEADISGKDGAKVLVEASAFVDANGNAVSGEIELRMTPVDVSSAAGIQAFPGSFSGILDDGSSTPIIVSFGTTEYNFSQNGEPLQLAPGQTAVIDMPMYVANYPNGDAINIGDEIPLWYLDEETGIWQQEGVGEVIANQASSVGLSMRATVSHFSWWNADYYPADEDIYTVNLTVVVVNENDDVVNGYNGEISNSKIRTPGSAFTALPRIGEVTEQTLFEGTWCFNAEAALEFGDGPELVVAPEVCVEIPGVESVSIRLNTGDRGLVVSNLVRETATINNDFGACGDVPRIDAKSLHPITFSIISGSLPPGLSLQPNGSITGSPTTDFTRSYQAGIQVEDESGNSEIVIVDIQVSSELEIREFNIKPVLEIGTSYVVNAPFSAIGGLTEYQWRLTGLAEDRTLPSNISFDTSNGSFGVTPGRLFIGGEVAPFYDYDMEISVEDQNCAKQTRNHLQPVIYVPILSGQPANIAATRAFSFTPTNTGLPATEWRIEAPDALFNWASFDNSTGELSGTPAVEDTGLYENITFIAYGPRSTDPLVSARIEKRLTVAFEVTLGIPNLDPISDFTLSTNQSLNYAPLNIGGVASSWEIDNAPAWLTFDSATGNFSGTPTVVATHRDIVVRAINAAGNDETAPFIIDVIAQLTAPRLTGTAPTGNVGVSYAFTPTYAGGLASSFSINNSNLLPPGLGFNVSNGRISGTPTQAGSYSGLEITASNTAGSGTLTPITIDINQGVLPLVFADPGPVQKTFGDNPFTNVIISGAISGSYTRESSDTAVATIGSLREVTILSVGQTVITITRNASANYAAASASYTLIVSPGIPTLAALPHGANLTEFYQYTPIVNGNTMVSWTLFSGTLPDGLSLNNVSGTISGTATAEGNFNFTLQGVNSLGDNFNFALNIQVGTQPSLTNQSNIDICTNYYGQEGGCALTLIKDTFASYQFVSDLGAVDTWSLSGDIPAGISIDSATGILSGTPGVSGSYSTTVNADNAFGSDSFTILISIP